MLNLLHNTTVLNTISSVWVYIKNQKQFRFKEQGQVYQDMLTNYLPSKAK